VQWTYTTFLYEEKIYIFIYIIINIVISYILGRLFIIVNNSRIIRTELYYGSFYSLISGRLPLIETSVITKISHEGKILMYSGILEDITFASDRTIDYVMLAYPVRRYFMNLTATPPATTDGVYLERPANSIYASLLINGDDIENIYFVRLQPDARFAGLLTVLSQVRNWFGAIRTFRRSGGP
jgi:hypothetical protein